MSVIFKGSTGAIGASEQWQHNFQTFLPEAVAFICSIVGNVRNSGRNDRAIEALRRLTEEAGVNLPKMFETVYKELTVSNCLSNQIVVTGHSRGGMLAVLFASWFKDKQNNTIIRVVTFADHEPYSHILQEGSNLDANCIRRYLHIRDPISLTHQVSNHLYQTNLFEDENIIWLNNPNSGEDFHDIRNYIIGIGVKQAEFDVLKVIVFLTKLLLEVVEFKD